MKSHLTLAVKEEIVALKNQIKQLNEVCTRLEQENQILKQHAMPETLLLIDNRGNPTVAVPNNNSNNANPINQKSLSKLLNVNIKTIQRNMDILQQFNCICPIKNGKEIFYIINPYIMYCGKDINMLLPTLFTKMGYAPSKDTRNNRRKIHFDYTNYRRW